RSIPATDEERARRTKPGSDVPDLDDAGVVLRIDDEDPGWRHEDVVDVALRARDTSVMQHPQVGHVGERRGQRYLACRSECPRADRLRIVTEPDDPTAETRAVLALDVDLMTL